MRTLEFQLVTTDHLVDRLWFRDDDDYKAGMNGVAVTACQMDIDILAFILMSNHVHFVLRGTREQALAFINGLKRHHSSYLQRRYGFKEYLRGNDVDIQNVKREDESLERAVAYVQMNSVAANICLHPTGYPWGTGDAFFKETCTHGRLLGTMSGRAQKRLLRSNKPLSQDLKVSNGYVLPESFVQVQYVESVFRTPARMNFFLINSSKAKRKIDTADSGLPAFRDQSILSALPDLCHTLFQKSSFQDLNWNQQAEIAKQIKKRFSADIHQIARITGVSYSEMATMLDSI